MKKSTLSSTEILSEARRVIEIESQAVKNLVERLDEKFFKACELMFACTGKIVVSGIGKSGQIGKKLASTLSSTGTPAVFIHPAEMSHGEMGVIAADQDLVLIISYGGESEELSDLFSFAQRHDTPIVALTGSSQSRLSKLATVSLDVSVKEEACPLKLAPTSSTTAALVMGDALAVCLMKMKGFRSEDFAEFHPGGSLGRKLLTRVQDIMHEPAEMVLVSRDTPMREVVLLMTQKPVRGVAGVVDEKGFLVGVITDGDLRRRLEQSKNPLEDKAKDLMRAQPKVVEHDSLAAKALRLFEQYSIQSLFVVDKATGTDLKPVGLLHLHDLLRSGIR